MAVAPRRDKTQCHGRWAKAGRAGHLRAGLPSMLTSVGPCRMEDALPETDRPAAPVVIKKYANRRLYDTESSIYITLDSLAAMVRQGRDFVVFDAKTGDDITRTVLTQIIVEEETKGRNMLPTVFLRQLIGFYGDSMQGLVPRYLEQMMAQFSQQLARQRQTLASSLMMGAAPGPPATAEDYLEEIRSLRAEVERLNRELAGR